MNYRSRAAFKLIEINEKYRILSNNYKFKVKDKKEIKVE